MSTQEIHLDDLGTEFRFTVTDGTNVVDLSGATEKKVYFKKADGTMLSKDLAFVTDGKDGLVKYVTADGDISVVGNWSVQLRIILTTGRWYSNVAQFRVRGNL